MRPLTALPEFQVGQAVKICRGSFSGMKGEVKKRELAAGQQPQYHVKLEWRRGDVIGQKYEGPLWYREEELGKWE